MSTTIEYIHLLQAWTESEARHAQCKSNFFLFINLSLQYSCNFLDLYHFRVFFRRFLSMQYN